MDQVILELRNERGVSQKAVAEAIGVSQSTIAKIEINRNEATASTIRKLADYFNVSADYLLERTCDDLGAVVMPGMSPRYTQLEEELIACFRKLPQGSKENLLGLARTLAAHA